MENLINVKNKLRVCHFPQIPCKPFIVDVKDEEQAYFTINTLANQHLFLFDNNFIPDYSNIILVQMLDDDNEWVDYYNEEMEEEWDYIEQLIKEATEL